MWKPTVHRKAVNELDYLRDNHPCIFEALVEAVNLLALEVNPAEPVNPTLNVCKLRNMKPWCRGKVKRTCRFVFRLLQSVDGELCEICDVEIDADADQHILQLVMITPRDDSTYERVQKRQEAMYQ